MRRIKKYLLTGLLVWAPLGITVWVIQALLGAVDEIMAQLPPSWRPDYWLLREIAEYIPPLKEMHRIPGFGIFMVLLILLVTGLLVANILGRRLLKMWESWLNRIPLVRGIYGSVKQVSDTLFSGSGQAFNKALLVRFPHDGAWTIAFQTGVPNDALAPLLDGEHVSVYVPTTPNPTSGYFVMVKKSEVIELEMSVDEALKYVISMGVVAPPENKDTADSAQAG